MKNKILSIFALSLILTLLVPFVSANEVTPELGCCMSFQRGYAELPDQCQQFELNEIKCEKMVKEWESFTFYWMYGDLILLVVGIAVVVGIVWYVRKRRKK